MLKQFFFFFLLSMCVCVVVGGRGGGNQHFLQIRFSFTKDFLVELITPDQAQSTCKQNIGPKLSPTTSPVTTEPLTFPTTSALIPRKPKHRQLDYHTRATGHRGLG